MDPDRGEVPYIHTQGGRWALEKKIQVFLFFFLVLISLRIHIVVTEPNIFISARVNFLLSVSFLSLEKKRLNMNGLFVLHFSSTPRSFVPPPSICMVTQQSSVLKRGKKRTWKCVLKVCVPFLSCFQFFNSLNIITSVYPSLAIEPTVLSSVDSIWFEKNKTNNTKKCLKKKKIVLGISSWQFLIKSHYIIHSIFLLFLRRKKRFFFIRSLTYIFFFFFSSAFCRSWFFLVIFFSPLVSSSPLKKTKTNKTLISCHAYCPLSSYSFHHFLHHHHHHPLFALV